MEAARRRFLVLFARVPQNEDTLCHPRPCETWWWLVRVYLVKFIVAHVSQTCCRKNITWCEREDICQETEILDIVKLSNQLISNKVIDNSSSIEIKLYYFSKSWGYIVQATNCKKTHITNVPKSILNSASAVDSTVFITNFHIIFPLFSMSHMILC